VSVDFLYSGMTRHIHMFRVWITFYRQPSKFIGR